MSGQKKEIVSKQFHAITIEILSLNALSNVLEGLFTFCILGVKIHLD